MDDLRKEFSKHVHERETPVRNARVRSSFRALRLGMALRKDVEPKDTVILATSDGRSLEKLVNGFLRLDIGDKPQHWSKDRAAVVASRWNRDNLAQDHVSEHYWRDFYTAQIARIKSR